MPKTVSASEAKNRLGAVVSWVLSNQDQVIIESRGAPTVVVISYEEYEKLMSIKEQQRRQDVLQKLRELRERVRGRNQDITTEEQAMQIADRFVREVIDDMVKEGKIEFEEYNGLPDPPA